MNSTASAGMPDTKIETLRDAITEFLDVMLVDQGYQLGLVQFNQNVVPFAAGSEDALDLHTTARAIHLKTVTIPSITAGGSTSIGDGLREAHNQLIASPSPADIDRVVLLVTDGKENQSEWISDVRTDLISSDVTVYVLGLGYGSGVDELKLVNLASDTEGTYRITADHLAFRKLFIEALAGVVDWSLVAGSGPPTEPWPRDYYPFHARQRRNTCHDLDGLAGRGPCHQTLIDQPIREGSNKVDKESVHPVYGRCTTCFISTRFSPLRRPGQRVGGRMEGEDSRHAET